jgi:hypothetical protein
LFLCALGAHPLDPKQETGTGRMTSFTDYFAVIRQQQQIYLAIEDLSNEHQMLAMAVDCENGAAFKVHTQVCRSGYTRIDQVTHACDACVT